MMQIRIGFWMMARNFACCLESPLVNGSSISRNPRRVDSMRYAVNFSIAQTLITISSFRSASKRINSNSMQFPKPSPSIVQNLNEKFVIFHLMSIIRSSIDRFAASSINVIYKTPPLTSSITNYVADFRPFSVLFRWLNRVSNGFERKRQSKKKKQIAFISLFVFVFDVITTAVFRGPDGLCQLTHLQSGTCYDKFDEEKTMKNVCCNQRKCILHFGGIGNCVPRIHITPEQSLCGL